MAPFEITDAPRIVPINDSEEVQNLRDLLRKANDDARQYRGLWSAVEQGELCANDVNLIMEALTALAEHKVAVAFELEAAGRKVNTTVSHMSRLLRRTAADARDLRDKFDVGGSAYIMPGDA